MISIEFFMPYLVRLCHIELLSYQETAWHTAKPCNSGTEVLHNKQLSIVQTKISRASKQKRNRDPIWSSHIRPYSKWSCGQIMKRLAKPKKSLIYRAEISSCPELSKIEGHKNEHFEPSNIIFLLWTQVMYTSSELCNPIITMKAKAKVVSFYTL